MSLEFLSGERGNEALVVPVSDEGHAGSARRAALGWAEAAGCDQEFAGRISLVVTELAKNLALHTTKGGTLIVRRTGPEAKEGVAVLSLDRGPGVENFSRCLRDGYSTAGTAGIGLGGVQRMARLFEMHSQPGVGTALYAELEPKGHRPGGGSRAGKSLGAVSVPIRGETICGDSWAEQSGPGWLRVMVADGLGHGPLAAEASRAACQIFRAEPERALPQVLSRMHETLRSTRGAAVLIAHMDFGAGEIRAAGVGNIAAATISHEKVSNLVSLNGTVGAAMPSQVREYSAPWTSESLLVMHSDGLRTQWQMSRYVGLSARHPELIAGVLFRDFARGSDDVTVVVARQTP